MKTKLLSIAVLAFALFSCTKEEVTPPITAPSTGSIKLKMDPYFNEIAFKLGDNYLSPLGDTLSFSKFAYYVSNIKLTKTDGTEYNQPESYYLVDHAVGAVNIEFSDIPAGDYKKITFTVGVDSARNVSGAQTGALDPVNKMFWSWNTGYIFMKVEGSSPQATTANKNFIYHVGGFSGTNNCVREISPDLGSTLLKISPSSKPSVHFHVGLDKFFNGVNQIRVSETANSHGGEKSVKFADNYATMFEVDHVH